MRILHIVVYSSRVRVPGDIIVVDTIRVYKPFRSINHSKIFIKVPSSKLRIGTKNRWACCIDACLYPARVNFRSTLDWYHLFLIPIGYRHWGVYRLFYSSRVEDMLVFDTIRVYKPFKNLHISSQFIVNNKWACCIDVFVDPVRVRYESMLDYYHPLFFDITTGIYIEDITYSCL